MQTKPKFRGLHQPKITQITKQQYRKFFTIRKLCSQAMGQHQLVSHSQKKYLCKQLPISTSFLTLRPHTQAIYNYCEQGNNKYIFQLFGEPLCDLWRNRMGQDIKDWISRCGGIQDALVQLVKYCVRLYQENGIEDILYECFRVSEGKVWYCYDSWMRSTYEIVLENNLEIQNYFLTQLQLKQLSRKTIPTINLTYKDFLYKLGLFIMSLALPDVKIRNYQYCQFTLNQSNIQQKLSIFNIKISNKQLQDLVNKFINHEIQTMDQVWKIVSGANIKMARGQSPSCYFSNKSNSKYDKQNSIVLIQKQSNGSVHTRKASTASKNESLNQNKLPSMPKKIRLRGTSGVLNQSINCNVSKTNIGQEQKQQKKQLNFKELFSKPPTDTCIKFLQYLGLNQYITQSGYQTAVINSLEGVRIKSQWKHKVYTNGSIYLGQFVGDKRDGKGIYLFDSEDLYIGQWKENSMHGYGNYVFRSGQSYSGELRKGLKQGFGKFSYKDGRVYQGHWQENLKSGFGTVIFPNGTKFLGFFTKSNQTFGLFTMIKGQQLCEFQGNLQNYNWQTNSFVNMQIGQQLLKNKLKKCKAQSYIPFLKDQGVRYFGEYSSGKPNGYGIKQNQTQIYEGNWINGKEDGIGKLVLKNKFQIQGIWQEGLLVEYKLK